MFAFVKSQQALPPQPQQPQTTRFVGISGWSKALFSFCLPALLGGVALSAAPTAQAQIAPNTVRVHYNRPDANFDGWVIYTWNGAAVPSPAWPSVVGPTAKDAFGAYWDVATKADATLLNYIINQKGVAKNCGNDQEFKFPRSLNTSGIEVWHLLDDCTIYTSLPATNKVGDVNKAKAHFLTRDTVAWPGAVASATGTTPPRAG